MLTFKKIVCIILVFAPVFITSGCWDNRDITQLIMVSGIGVDKAPDGSIEVTVQIISHPQQGGAQSGSGFSQSSSQSTGGTIITSAEGSTVADAVFNLVPKIGQNVYLMHTQLMVIGEAAAYDGIDKIWDYFERDHESSRTMWVIVAKGSTAKSVLTAKPELENINAVEITDTMQENVNFGKVIGIKAFKVSDTLSQPRAGLVLSVIEPAASDMLKDMNVQGGAVFKHAKLVGYLDTDETRGYLFAANQLYGTMINIEDPKEKGRSVSVEIIKSDGKLNAAMTNGKPELSIEIEANGNIAGVQGSQDITDGNDIKALTDETEDVIRQNISEAIVKSQKNYDSDILDFNNLLYKYHYSDFQKIAGNWDAVYKNADINIDVKVILQRSGIIKKPAFNP
jgi:spore germination protein KC